MTGNHIFQFLFQPALRNRYFCPMIVIFGSWGALPELGMNEGASTSLVQYVSVALTPNELGWSENNSWDDHLAKGAPASFPAKCARKICIKILTGNRSSQPQRLSSKEWYLSIFFQMKICIIVGFRLLLSLIQV